MNKQNFRLLKLGLENLEKNLSEKTTILDEQHKMKMKEDIILSFDEMSEIYQSLQDLERADLFDFGRFNGNDS